MSERGSRIHLKINIPELSYTWEDYASEYPREGQPGITYREHELGPDVVCAALLYYETDGRLRGILHYFPNDIPVPEPWMKPFAERAGNFNVIVDPTSRRLGIGMKLLHEAARRWPINFERQNYTREGAKLVQRFLQRSRTRRK